MTAYNQWTECKYRGITLLVHQDRLDQAKQLIDASLDHPNPAPKPTPTPPMTEWPSPHNLAQYAEQINHPGPFYLTVHPTQHGEALLALCQLAYEGHQIHLYLTDHQKPGQWHLSTEPLPGTRPAPRYEEDEEQA